MKTRGKIYFASDFHLGLNSGTNASEREKNIVRWLDEISHDACEIYLLGDIFDFWWEYRLVVPRGFTRFLGKISSITDSGVPVHFFTGNHDMWVRDYLSQECGMKIHTGPISVNFDGKIFHLAHGEGLGTLNNAYKILLWIFRNKTLRVLYSALHPAIGVGIGHRWSHSSRLAKGDSTPFLGEDREDLLRYARSVKEKENIDYFIFGHRHLAMSFAMKEGAEAFFLGDWITNSTYAVWDGTKIELKIFS
ncbi:MAG: UDP-2,3-diacylglucosamine diphosphatase [Bacteroidales bacterium]|nr:UDP-2,3-diacylglucosamine diphosphatase [Bacteroidales bacterium]MBN2632011.1 UDP-2,3-diacylglucosamine diphosphatase [Bacteroidales bacterium]